MLTTNETHLEGDDVLADFFSALADDNIQALRSIHIPRSDVFYVRQKYFQDTGHWVSLDRMERAMYLEGHLHTHDVKDPHKKREWE
jgi:hypothetical protein